MMRSVCFLTLAMLVASGCRSPWGASQYGEISATATFRVDPSNGVWDEEYGSASDPDTCSFVFRIARYADGIGVDVTVRDDKIVTDDCQPGDIRCKNWNDDCVEVFFDGDGDGSRNRRFVRDVYYGGQYALCANGAARSECSSAPGGFGSDWTGTVYSSELPGGGVVIFYRLRFSWKCVGYVRPPAVEDEVSFGFNICVHDDDSGGRSDRALYWKGTPTRPYLDESRFEKIVLKGRGK